jgi:hypothetical protein
MKPWFQCVPTRWKPGFIAPGRFGVIVDRNPRGRAGFRT